MPPPPAFYEFLLENREKILEITEQTSLQLAGVRPSSALLKSGLPIFFDQLVKIIKISLDAKPINPEGMVKAAAESNEPALAKASGHDGEVELAREAGLHGKELLRLGYTLSHVVHAYGAMCQAITNLAAEQNIIITSNNFRDFNRCLDVAIAGAVTEYQSLKNVQEVNREVKHLGYLAHELRNALTSVCVSIQLIKKGSVGFAGNTGQVLDRSLLRLQELIDRSLTEVRLRVDPELHPETGNLLHLIDQIIVTADVTAEKRNQTLEIQVDPTLDIEADLQLYHSAVSNLIQNALKYTPDGGKIQVRGNLVGEHIVVEVEDECGGLPANSAADLFRPYVQQHVNRKGLGLGLAIAQRAILLNHGTIEARNLPGKGCIFTITLPKKSGHGHSKETSS